MPDLLDQYLAGEKEKEPDLLEQYLATKPIKEEIPAKEPTWWEAAWGTVTEAPSNLKEAFLKLDEYTYYEPLDVSKWIPKATEALGNTWTWAVRFLPGNEDLPDWEDQTEGQKIWTSTQATAMVGAVTEAIRQGISVPKAIRASGRMKRIAKMPTTRAEALKGAGKKVEITRGFAVKEPEVRLKPIKPAAGAPSITREVTAEIHAIKPAILKTVKTLQFKDTIHKQLYDLVSKYKPSPTSVDMEPFYKTADALTGTPLKGLINPAYGEVTYNQINKVLPFMLNQLVTSGKATAQIKEVAPEEQIVDTEIGRKLTPTPEEYAAPEVAPRAEIPEVKPEVLAEEITLGVEPPTKPPIPPSPPPREMPEFGAEPERDPVTRLNELIKAAKPLRGKLEKAYTAERGKRIAALEQSIKDNIEKVGGEKAWEIAVSKLKGPLAPKEMKFALEPVKDKLTQEELDSLYARAANHPYLAMWEKTSAVRGLSKLLVGGVPQPKELLLLEEIYGTELIKNILAKRAWGVKATDFLVELANIPRALLATADMSYYLRQAIIPAISHPVTTAKMVGKSAQFGISPKVMQEYYDELPKHRHYKLMRQFRVQIINPEKGRMADREEPFMSRFIQKVPILKYPVGFAERAHTGGLTKLRVDLFSLYADDLLRKDLTPEKNPEEFQAAATISNVFTGRGSLGEMGNRVAPALNVLFWSPRLNMARFYVLNPVNYIKMPKEMRKKAMGDVAKSFAVLATTIALIKLYTDATGEKNIDAEVDPRSSDWGKVRVGNTRYDIWGGHIQWARFFLQFASGQRKDTETGEILSLTKDQYPFTTRKEVVIRFVEGKMAPVAGLLWKEALSGGYTWTGEKVTPKHMTEQLVIPMWITDVADAYMDGDLTRALPTAPLAFGGVGVQTWELRKKKRKRVTY